MSKAILMDQQVSVWKVSKLLRMEMLLINPTIPLQ